MATASARHILVNDEAFCNELKEKINSGEISFEQAAKEKSGLNTIQSMFMVEIIEALEIAANEIEDAVDVMKILGIKYQISPLIHHR